MNLLLVLAFLASGSCFANARVIAVPVHGVVHPITVSIVAHAIEQASREQASALLIRLNTPGGLMEATRQINELIISSPVPVIMYVGPSGGRAASAGFFLLQAGDVAAMTPGTNTGAASPVLLGQEMDPVMRKKIESDSSAALRSLTGKRHRNSELAEKTVLEAKSFTETEALESRLIDLIAPSEQQLFQALEGKEIERFNGTRVTLHLAGATVTEYAPTLRERLVSSVADPNLAYLILLLGGLCLYIEFNSPGLFLPGVAGAILALLGLSALAVLPINWVGAALLLVAMAFFILEAKFASHGILGTGGVVAMILGAMLLVDGPPEVRIRFGTALGASLPFAAITIFLVTLVVRARKARPLTGENAMVGTLGIAYTALDPQGKVHVRGEYWNATSSAPVAAGGSVRILAVKDLALHVEPVQP